jgi:hypothetical protein
MHPILVITILIFSRVRAILTCVSRPRGRSLPRLAVRFVIVIIVIA